ncbi:MAG: ATP-binding protein [Pseudomonadota bacterium]
MRLGLRRQLFLIGLITLILPLTSTVYVRETERALQAAQAQFLTNLTRSVAATLGPTLPGAATAAETVFAVPLAQSPTLDGYLSDWNAPADIVATGSFALALGEYQGTLWLHAALPLQNSAPVQFSLICRNAEGAYGTHAITVSAAGPFALPGTSAGDAPIRGAWQPGARRGQLELRLPRGTCQDELGLIARTASQDFTSYSGTVPSTVLRMDTDLAAALSDHRSPGTEAYLVNALGWRVTPILGNLGPIAAPSTDSWQSNLYRRILGNNIATSVGLDDRWLQDGQWLQPALTGSTITRRARTGPYDDTVVTVIAQPLPLGATTPSHVLVVRQSVNAILTLTNPSLVRLTGLTLGTTLVVVLLLLAYATWLSWRVRRLARAAGNALTQRGEIRAVLPEDATPDEIGDVARSFATLLKRVSEQQAWLKSLADTLSHELRTPIAVVQSSLDNLAHSDLDERQRSLSTRASDGVMRLNAILNAMSTANRASEAARGATLEPLDLSALVTQLQSAYSATFAAHDVTGDVAPGAVVNGNAELLVQALDKLIENAASFAPAGSAITLALTRGPDHALVTVSNLGPPLPEGDPARLFDTFTSHREERQAGHLGFGLYIARQIIEAHDGDITATTLPGGDGACFTLRLPVAGSAT